MIKSIYLVYENSGSQKFRHKSKQKASCVKRKIFSMVSQKNFFSQTVSNRKKLPLEYNKNIMKKCLKFSQVLIKFWSSYSKIRESRVFWDNL